MSKIVMMGEQDEIVLKRKEEMTEEEQNTLVKKAAEAKERLKNIMESRKESVIGTASVKNAQSV